MPKMSGIEVIQRLKEDQRTRHIPIVVLTSSKEDPDIKTCYDLGVNGYVVKPVEFEAFHHAISTLGLFWLIVNQAPQ
jgi:two-component system response regulator